MAFVISFVEVLTLIADGQSDCIAERQSLLFESKKADESRKRRENVRIETATFNAFCAAWATGELSVFKRSFDISTLKLNVKYFDNYYETRVLFDQ